MATNIPDFTRYMRNKRGVYWQALMLPAINLLLSVFGTISTSCAKVVYGTYIWDPLELVSYWDGPSGRCGAFFVGLCWVVGQIGTNLSASIISASNDLTNLFPKYMNIRRGSILVSLISGWIMVPWKIVYSAESLITFISALAIFLAPIASILASDYWIVKQRNFDVPGLYRRHGRYEYDYGINWRAALAFLVAVTPVLPGLANSVNSNVKISAGLQHIYDCNYLYSFLSGAFVYVVLSKVFPAPETLLEAPIYDDPAILDSVECASQNAHGHLDKLEAEVLEKGDEEGTS
jgi:nucleobase:cation symporter-1, NCS1 family